MKVYVVVAAWAPDDLKASEAEASVVGVTTTLKGAAILIAQDIIADMTGDVEDEDLPDPNLFISDIMESFKDQKATGRWDFRNDYSEYQYVVQLEKVQNP